MIKTIKNKNIIYNKSNKNNKTRLMQTFISKVINYDNKFHKKRNIKGGNIEQNQNITKNNIKLNNAIKIVMMLIKKKKALELQKQQKKHENNRKKTLAEASQAGVFNLK